MFSAEVYQLTYQSLLMILILSGPPIIISTILGLLVAIFQAATQIQEQTLAFVPKIVAVLLSILVFGPWIMNTLVDFTFNLLNNLYKFVG